MSAPAHSAIAPTQALPHVPAPQRAVLFVLAVASLVGATGLAAGGSAGALLGERLAGDAAAGLPLGLLVLGSAGAALLISRLTVRLGRGRSLAVGYLIGDAGAALVILAAETASLVALLIGSTLLGAANAAIFLTRYAAAELGGAGARGRALGIVFFATALGAVTSAAVLGPSGGLARAVGLPGEAGLYLVALAAFAVAAAMLAAASASRLRRVGRHAALLGPTGTRRLGRGELRAGLRVPAARTALVALATTNFVMVGVMAVAPVHLTTGGMTLQLIGVVIAIHVAGMFAPAPASGWLADRAGASRVVATSAIVLIPTSLAGATTDAHAALASAIALALLGISWNLGIVGASTQLVSAVPQNLRPHAEGIGEVALGVAAAVGAPVAGLAAHVGGLAAVWLASAAIAGVNLIVLYRFARQQHGGPVAEYT